MSSALCLKVEERGEKAEGEKADRKQYTPQIKNSAILKNITVNMVASV